MKIALRLLSVILVFAAMLLRVQPARAAPPSFVIVSLGDTLYDVAACSGTSVDELVRVNSLPSANFVYAGQILIIPETNSESAASRSASANAASPSASIYTVSYGDTLYSLAVRFGTTTQEMARVNGLYNPNFIYTGQRLNLPGRINIPAPRPTRAPAAPAPRPDGSASLTTWLAEGSRVTNPPTSGKWIDVDASQQTITAYDGTTPLKTVLVSTGLPRTPTVLGRYAVYVKLTSQTMTGGNKFSGDYYYLPGVPWIMYFYQGYAIHGTYWHNNFGHPMSHGCVNLTIEDAKWFFDWAEMGTTVITHA